MVITTDIEEKIEQAYWEWDAIKKGYSQRGTLMTERDAFKMLIRKIISEIPEQKQETNWSEP